MSFSVSSGAGQAAQVQQWRARQFARADQDKSGGLSLDEFTQMAAGRRAGPAANSAGNPADSTQATAGTQANAAIQDGFKRIDSNNDGSLSQAELAAARPGLSPSQRPDTFSGESFRALLASQGGDQGQANQQASQAELEGARPGLSPSQRPDTFSGESFRALLASQGGDQGQANQQASQAGRARHRHHSGQADQGGMRPNASDAGGNSDPATLRRLAAYQAQQAFSMAGARQPA